MNRSVPFTTILRNGERVLLREIGPADRPLLRDGFARLSDQSRFFRFLGAHGPLSEDELDQFTEENNADHFAIGAVAIGTEADLPLATARFVRIVKDSTEAEIALTIIDSHQRLGLGSILLRTLSEEAQSRGFTRLLALLHQRNSGMAALLGRFGAERVETDRESLWALSLPLSAPPEAVPVPLAS
ncbi:MAG: GNAT family N-acetyltransferase [Sulfitobacter sp.]|nr:GNAT family N-acetyltransferase [Sulfitobacter sp.]